MVSIAVVTDKETFFAMPIDPLSDASARIVYAVETVTGLLPYIHSQSEFALPPLVGNACLEAWFINVRLIAEFLMGTNHDKSMEADDFLPNWRIADPQTKDAIGRELGLASEYVAHIGKRTKVGRPVDTSLPALSGRALLLLDALETFTRDLDSVNHDHASAFLMAVSFGRLNLQRYAAGIEGGSKSGVIPAG